MAVTPEIVDTPLEIDDNMLHIVCKCTPDKSRCGRDVSMLPWSPRHDSGVQECVVCVDMEWKPCPLCGKVHNEQED